MENKLKSDAALSNAKQAVVGIQRAIASLVKKRASIQEEKAALLERAAALYDMPLSHSEIKQLMCEMIDLRAETYGNRLIEFNLMKRLKVPDQRYPIPGGVSRARSPMNFEDAEFVLGRPRTHGARADNISGNGWHLPIFMGNGEFDSWQYFFFGDVMKEKLCLLMDKMADPSAKHIQESQPKTLDDRRQELEEIKLKIASLDNELSGIAFEINTLTSPIINGAQGLSSYALGRS